MEKRSASDSPAESVPGKDSPRPRVSLLGRMLRLAAVLVVLALVAIAFVAADQYTIPFEYEGFD